MKKSMVGFCLMTCAAFAQSPVLLSEQNERSLSCFVVVQSSGTVLPGTVLYPVEPEREQARRLNLVTVFTNSPYHLKYDTGKTTQVTNTFNVGTTRVARVGTRYEKERSLFDGRRWYGYDYTNRVYVYENDFVMLERTNILIRQQIADPVARPEKK